MRIKLLGMCLTLGILMYSEAMVLKWWWGGEPPTQVIAARAIDGDTFSIENPPMELLNKLSWRVRIRGIDTPEMHGKCRDERQRAVMAKQRLAMLLNQGRVELTNVAHDKYGGRLLADVHVNGKLVAKNLLQEHLAMNYTGHGSKPNWCGG